jgi:SPP1 gp7 family putative phage head morphogenesis protein
MAATSDNLLKRLLEDGATAYREAVAARVEGKDASEAWDRWTADTAAILLVSWAMGATASARAAGVPLREIREPPVSRFDRGIDNLTMRFESGPAREVVDRFIRLLPMTREKWEALIAHAFSAAGELRDDEAANALSEIAARSPDLAALISGTARPEPPKTKKPLPEAVKVRRTPAVQAAVQGSFFATGMTQEQVEGTRDLLAKAIRGEVTKSVAGKTLIDLGVGDFVEQTVLETGTDLTAARLETIYRTNINRAQTQGQLDICRDPVVRKFAPLMRFRATKDTRTRESHRALDGYIATTDQIDGMGIPTPLGFNCRCSWTPIPIAKALAEGLCDEDGVPDMEAIRRANGNRQALIDKGLIPDPGFISG